MVNLNDIKLFLHKINKYQIKSQENSNIPNNLKIYGQKLNYYVKQLGGASYGDVTDEDIDISIEVYIETCKKVDDENKKNNIPTKQIVLDTREKVLQVLNGVKNIKDQERKNKYYREHTKCALEYKYKDQKKYLDCEIELNKVIQNINNNQSNNITDNISDKVIVQDLTDKDIDGLIEFSKEMHKEADEYIKKNNIPIPNLMLETRVIVLEILNGLKNINDQNDRNIHYKRNIECLNNSFNKETLNMDDVKYLECAKILNQEIKEYLKNQQK
jgi:hypothetical protein